MAKKQARIPKNFVTDSARRIRYMGHPLRLRILEYLDINGATNVSELMDYFGASQVIISQSLRRLRRDGLVADVRRGKFVYYELKGDAVSRLFRCIRRNHGILLIPDSAGAKKEHLPVDVLTRIAEKISFLGHPMRFQIVEFLFANGPACVCEIMDDVNSGQVPVSLNLKKMKAAGVVSSTRNGQYNIYELSSDLPRTLMECMHLNLATNG